MSAEPIRVSPAWLDLRESADAAARARELVARLPHRRVWVIHDLACGTGSMGRWLAPLLPGAQHWVLHDRDAELLELAEIDDVTVETRVSDITQLRADDLAEATLVTASALLDLLTGDELDAVIRACAGRPVLFALSVTGRVALTPADPLDARVAAGFNAHQRRGGLLGPDAVDAAVEGFRRLGADVIVAPSPWRLGAADGDLVPEWFAGWFGAACELDAELEADGELYRRCRLRDARAGRLAVTVGHADLVVLP